MTFILKFVKTHFKKKLKNEVFSKKFFLALKALFPPKYALSQTETSCDSKQIS
jgi:hypothetical protein